MLIIIMVMFQGSKRESYVIDVIFPPTFLRAKTRYAYNQHSIMGGEIGIMCMTLHWGNS